MRNPGLSPAAAAHESSETRVEGRGPAAQGSIPEPVSVTENPAPAPPADLPAEAQGRRTLSIAIVMMSPGGHLTVELRDGRELALRDVVMRQNDYCGVQLLDGSAGRRYCGRYGDVAAARPTGGGEPTPDVATPAVLNAQGRSPSERE